MVRSEIRLIVELKFIVMPGVAALAKAIAGLAPQRPIEAAT
jgi:hypothetical protein